MFQMYLIVCLQKIQAETLNYLCPIDGEDFRRTCCTAWCFFVCLFSCLKRQAVLFFVLVFQMCAGILILAVLNGSILIKWYLGSQNFTWHKNHKEVIVILWKEWILKRDRLKKQNWHLPLDFPCSRMWSVQNWGVNPCLLKAGKLKLYFK